MKRLLTCVSIAVAVCVVFGLIARERSILRAAEERARQAEATARHALERAREASSTTAPANAFAPLQAEPDLAFSQAADEPTPVLALQTFGQVDPAAVVDDLRQKYVEQQAVKALLMQAEDLRLALDSTNHEIRELDAQTQLKAVSETLAKLVENFEGTQAAPVAERMLDLYRNPEPAMEEPGAVEAVEAPADSEAAATPEDAAPGF